MTSYHSKKNSERKFEERRYYKDGKQSSKHNFKRTKKICDQQNDKDWEQPNITLVPSKQK